MTVKELIEQLQTLDPNLTVAFSDSEYGYTSIDSIHQQTGVVDQYGNYNKPEKTFALLDG